MPRAVIGNENPSRGLRADFDGDFTYQYARRSATVFVGSPGSCIPLPL